MTENETPTDTTAIDAEIDQALATFREKGLPDFDTLFSKVCLPLDAMRAIGIPTEVLLGGVVTSLVATMRRLAQAVIGDDLRTADQVAAAAAEAGDKADDQ